jgi:hypothetical protein
LESTHVSCFLEVSELFVLKAIFNLNFVTYCTLRTKEKLVMINFAICQERGIFENMKIRVEVSFIDIFLMIVVSFHTGLHHLALSRSVK